MIMLDVWCYEIITLQSGFLPIEMTAAQIIVCNIQVLCAQVPLGISIAASTLIGQAIGEGSILKAKSFIKLIIIFTVVLFSGL